MQNKKVQEEPPLPKTFSMGSFSSLPEETAFWIEKLGCLKVKETTLDGKRMNAIHVLSATPFLVDPHRMVISEPDAKEVALNQAKSKLREELDKMDIRPAIGVGGEENNPILEVRLTKEYDFEKLPQEIDGFKINYDFLGSISAQ